MGVAGRPARANARASKAFLRARPASESGTAPGHAVQRCIGEAVGDQRGGGGVADAHLAETHQVLAETHQVGAVVGERVGKRAPARDRFTGLGFGHRRLLDEAGRARSDLGVHEPRADPEGVIHARIDYGQPEPHLAAEHVDRRAAGEEILHHLPGDFLRIGRHAGARRTVVAGEHHDVGPDDCRRASPLDQGASPLDQADLQRQGFEPAEGAGGLGLAVDQSLEGRSQIRIEGGDGEFHRRAPDDVRAAIISAPV